jgi:hypothetical protein
MADQERTPEIIEAELQQIADAQKEQSYANIEELDKASTPDADAIAADREASRQGWVPKDKYKGDPAKWVDAKTFIQRGERFNTNLQREVAELREQIKGFEGTKAAFKKFHEETLARKDEEFKTALVNLRVQRSEAIRNGEDEEAIALEDRIDAMKDAQKALKAVPAEPAKQPTAEITNPVMQEWLEDGNSWFNDDSKLRDYSVKLGEELLRAGETARGRKFLDLISEKMREDFPRYFRTEGTRRAGAVESGSSGSGGGGGKTERDLPPEDLALMKQFVAEGWHTKESFLKSYFSRNG